MGLFLTNRWVHTLILLAVLFGAVGVRVHDDDWIKSLRYMAFDSYNRIKPRPVTGTTAIVDIDENSLARGELGQWPWSRQVLATLVDNLAAMGAKAVVFDMVFAEADRTSPQAILDRLPPEHQNQALDTLLEELPDNDALFADAMDRAGNVVTAFIWTDKKDETRRKPHLAKPILLAKQARDLNYTVPHMRGVATNLPVLSKASAGSGSFGVSAELDGIIRRVPLLFSFEDQKGRMILYPSLAVEALRVAENPKNIIRIKPLGAEEMTPLSAPLKMNIGSYNIPLDWDGKFNVWFSPKRPEQYIPAWRVIDGSADPAAIKDKIVFVGTSAAGLKDIRSTPLDLYIPGVEVHVNVVEQILSGEFLQRPRLFEGLELIALIGAGTLILALAPFVGAVAMSLLTLILVWAMGLVSWTSFDHYGLLLDPVYSGLCVIVLAVMATLLSYIRAETERKRVRQAFGLYISPDFMKELTKDPDKLRLGGELRDLTIMFSDIRNFTTISESLTPEELTRLMNDFLTPMSDVVMERRGTIDKYMGDAMMAFWNAPLDDGAHARHACEAALQMSAALAPLNEMLAARAAEEGKTPIILKAGIGLNTGPASVGNMGSKQRFAYSVLGDAVNLASRLEGQTKAYGVDILIGEGTQTQVPEMATMELDLIRVKGKTEPVRIFALLGDTARAAEEGFKSWRAQHDEMMAAYRAGQFSKAEKLIKACRTLADGELSFFYDMFAARIKDLKKTPPDKWDGVYIATSK